MNSKSKAPIFKLYPQPILARLWKRASVNSRDLTPPTTAAMAWALFGESLPPVVLLGFAITAFGVALVMKR